MKKFRFTAFNRLAGAILVFASILIISSSASAQSITDGSTPLALSPGAPAGSYSLSDFDSVNPYNGNLGFSLPLVKIGGRGGAGYAMGARIEQKWLVEKEPRPGQPTLYTPSPAWWNIEGFRSIFSMGRMDTRQAGSTDYIIACGSYIHRETLTRLTFTAPDGTEYELRDQLTNGRPDHPTCATNFNRGRVFVTSDGSVATFISDTDISDYVDANSEPVNAPPSGYLTLRDGTHYRIDGGVVSWMRDRNGNKLLFTYSNYRVTSITDSLNRQITIAYATQIPGYDQITLKGFGGATRTIKVYKAYLQNALRSDFSLQSFQQLFPELNGAYSNPSNPPVISAIELPNGQQYQLFYNSYAELARVVLPTGGAIEYDYAAGLTDGATSGVLPNVYGGDKHVYRRVIERRIYPDGGNGAGYANRMTYSRPETLSSNAGYVVVDQYNSSGTLLGRSSHYFYGSPRASFNQQPTQYPGWKDGREYQMTVFAANGTTPLRQVSNTFAQRAAVSWWTGDAELAPPNDTRLIETTSTLTDTNQVSKQTFGYDDSVPFNNQNNVKEYDFGSGAAGGLVRETRTTFVTSSSYTGTDVSLLSLPLQTSVYDGAGVERARATFEYDNYNTDANHAALLNRTGISGFDSSFSTSYLTRGNATATTRYLLVNGSVTGSITSYAQYDIAGNAVKAIDARGNAATLDYSDRFGSPDGEARSNSGASELAGQYSYAFPTLVTNALGHTAYSQFDYYLGRPVDGEDANGIVSSGYYNDALDRPTQMIRAANQGAGLKSQSAFSYDDGNHIVTSTSDQNSYGDNLLKSQTVYDGLGRTTDKRQYETATDCITVRQTYDALGRAYQISNPFRSGETVVWTTNAYDALSRVTSITTPDSAVVNTSYSGSTVTVTDQAGKARKSVTDGLGRLIQVYEDPAVLNYLTSYSYDTLDNLMNVTQGSQPARSFVYDSLKRLTSATNPESGTISYQYDNNGNLLNKTDARSIVSTYVYDVLNRVTSRSYSDGTPAVSYFYDAQSLPSGAPSYTRGYSTGRLVATTYGASSSTGDYYGFDAAGRTTLKIQQTGTVNYQTSAAYSLAGAMTTETYPSGHTATYAYDQAGRTTSLSGNLGDGASRTYSTGIIYSSLGGMAKEQLGTTTPIYNKLFYNVRGQLAEIRESTSYTGPTDTTWDRGAIINHYSNTCWGMCSGHTMTDNNGNLQKQDVYNPDSTLFTQFYGYDALNRLQKAKESLNGAPVNWQQQYVYDRYGNRTIDQANTYGTGIPKPNFGVDTNTNRLTAPAGSTMSYDAAGNLTFDNSDGIGGTRTYDAENKMKQAWANNQWQTYTYDGDGQRIKRNVNGTETWQVYGLGGELIAEYAASAAASSPQKEYGYRNGQLLITAEAGSGGGGSGPQNVTWTNAVGVSVNGNSLTKTTADGWTSGAASTQSIASGDGYVEFTATESTTNRMLGLSHGDSDQSYQDIDFGFYESAGSLCVYEAAVYRGCFGTYANGDTLRVAVEGGVVKYKKNGTLLYTSTVTPTYPLLADTSLYSNGSTISSAVLSTGASGGTQNASFTNAAGVSVSGNSLTKTAADGWGNAGAASTQSIASGDGYVEFTATESTTYRMLGLSHGDSDQSFQDIDFGLYVADGGTLYVWEAGVARGVVGYFATGDILRVAVEGGVVKYKKNGTVVYTSTVAPTYPLLVDTSIYSNGGTLNNVVISGASGGGGSSAIHWLVTDQLGTPRMIFDQSGSLSTVSRHDYLPFGEEIFAGTGGRTQAQGYTLSDNVRQKFTQKERDNETGLDYSINRYYSSIQGRFTSPDPLLASGRGGQPQSWNRYSYVINRPLSLVDPNGLDWGQWDDEKGKRNYWYFSGKVGSHNGHTYTAVQGLANGGSRLVYDDSGELFRIRNNSRNYLEDLGRWAAASVANPAQDQVNQLGGLLHGVGSALAGFNPGAHLLVNAAVNQIGGVDPSDSGFQNASAIGSGFVAGTALFIGPEAGAGELTLLNKQLASESQAAEVLAGQGTSIMGAGTGRVLNDAGRLAAEYGGSPGQWAKVTSWAYKAADGSTIEVHAYQNVSTGRVVELKSVSSAFKARQ